MEALMQLQIITPDRLIAMVAMAPLIAVQVMGVSYNMKLKKASTPAAAIIGIDDNEILDFEEDF